MDLNLQESKCGGRFWDVEAECSSLGYSSKLVVRGNGQCGSTTVDDQSTMQRSGDNN